MSLRRRGSQPRAARTFPSAAARQPERADARRVVGRALLHVVADIPYGAVVARVDRGLRVILPPQRRHLRRLALDEHGLAHREDAERVAHRTPREALTGEVGTAAEGVADPDAARLVYARATHPSKLTIRRERGLLPDGERTIPAAADFQLGPG